MDSSQILRIPVAPYVAEYNGVKDVVLSMVGTAPPQNIRLPKLPNPPPKLQALELVLASTDISVLVDIGVGTMVSAKVSTNIQYFLMDLVMSVDVPIDDPQCIFAAARYGVGFRIGVAAWDIKFEGKVNLGMLAAGATLDLAKTAFDVSAVGGGLPVLTATKPIVASFGARFDVGTLAALSVVRQNLMDLYNQKKTVLQPQLLAVTIDPSRLAAVLSNNVTTDYSELLRGQNYAINRARRNRSLEEALAERSSNPAWTKINADLVQQTYERAFGVVGRNQRPLDVPESQLRVDLVYRAGT